VATLAAHNDRGGRAVTEGPSIGEYLDEMVRDASKLHDMLVEAARHQARGDEQSACEVVALSHYELGHLRGERTNLLTIYEQRGVTPGS